MKIESTKEYSIFKILICNRPLDKHHLKKLKIDIDADNQLAIHPIIVNKNFEIIDGQHRLEVAKMLGVPIFYIRSESIQDSHIISCNVNQKTWDVETYINLFCQRDKLPDYIEFNRMLKTTKLKPKSLICLIMGSANAKVLDFLKTGKFKLPNESTHLEIIERFCDFIAYCVDKRIKPLSMFTNGNFTKAFRWLLMTSQFNWKIFIGKLDNKWFDLKPQRNAEDWYRLLISIYNFKNQNRLNDEYTS